MRRDGLDFIEYKLTVTTPSCSVQRNPFILSLFDTLVPLIH